MCVCGGGGGLCDLSLACEDSTFHSHIQQDKHIYQKKKWIDYTSQPVIGWVIKSTGSREGLPYLNWSEMTIRNDVHSWVFGVFLKRCISYAPNKNSQCTFYIFCTFCFPSVCYMFPIFNVHNELLWLIISITQKEKNKPQIKDRWCARSPQSDSEVLVPSTAPSAPG